ncbi:KGK family protein [Euhalothece natronophila Z-M001]|uniref:KGK family protein n=1 Tax=Euhalothece natronophila Z-M001 TaxID=522448 RepID=A0A5B8NKM8_9CHRO|nr:KGK domain-containing protein [Euhalothece natronophila]QDZ39437.1 KGK family protein [Euhalothece natronophila Z-M001]
MNNKYIQLNRQDVISTQDKQRSLLNKTFTVEEFLQLLTKIISEKVSSWKNPEGREKEAKKWTEEGINCKVLSPQSHWKTGKVRITLEFIPDEPESPLDNVRNQQS